MKKIYIYLAIAALLASCEVTEQIDATSSSILRIEANVPEAILTRGGESSIVKSAFRSGDKIAIIDDSYNAFAYTFDDSGWNPDNNALTISDDEPLSFTATYKPAGEIMDPTQYGFQMFVDELEASASITGTSSTIVPKGTITDQDFTLKADIDLSGINWTPIMANGTYYEGNFDGGGHTIRGLEVNVSTQNAGLFGMTRNSSIRNLHVEGNVISTKGSSRSGGIIGNANTNVTIIGCSFVGSVDGRNAGGNP